MPISSSLKSDLDELEALSEAENQASKQKAYAEFQAVENPQQPVPSGDVVSAPTPSASAMDILRQPSSVPYGGAGGLGGLAAQALGAVTGSSEQDVVDTAIRSVPLAASIAGGLGAGVLSGGNPAAAAGGAAMGNLAGELAIAPYRISKNEPALKPAQQLGLESAVQGFAELTGPATTKLLNWGLKKAVGPFQRDIPIDTRIVKESVGVRKANDILKNVAQDMYPALERKYGKDIADNITSGVLMTTDLTENRVLDLAENYAGPSVFGGKKIRALRQAQQDIIDDIPNFIAKTYGEVLDPEDVADALVSTISNIDEVRKGQAGSLFDYVGKALRTTEAPADPAYLYTRMSPKFGKQIVESTGSEAGLVDLTKLKSESGPISRLRGSLRELNLENTDIEGTKSVLDLVDSLPDKASFDSVKQVRNFLGNIRRSLRMVDPKSQKIAVLSEADTGLAKAMHSAVKAYDATRPNEFPLSRVFRFANQSYKDIEERTSNAIIEGWMESVEKKGAGPEVIGKLIDTPKHTRLFLSSVGRESRAADMMRQWHVQSLWDKARTKAGGFDPDEFVRLLTNDMKSDAGVTRELWGDEGIQTLRRFAVGPKMIGTKDTTMGRGALALREGGIIISAAAIPGAMTYAAGSDEKPSQGSDYVKSALGGVAAYAMSVRFLTSALASPTLRKAVLDARRFGPKTSRGISAVNQLLAAATKSDVTPIPTSASRNDLAVLNEAIGRGK